MSNSIRLHPEFGLNPTMPVCFWCGEPNGEIALLGAGYKGEAPMHLILNREPCMKCRAHWAEGIVFQEGESELPHEPTGRWLVLTEDAVRRLMSDSQELLKNVLARRAARIEKTLFDRLLAEGKDPEA